MAFLDGELLEIDITCFFKKSNKIKLGALVLGMHPDMAI